MRSSLLVTSILLATCFAPAGAQTAPKRMPGLWEVQTVSGGGAAGGSGMEQALAQMPPEQRAQMEQMMKVRGISQSGGNTTFTARYCLTAQEVADEATRGFYPKRDRDADCQNTTVSRTATELRFSAVCKRDGKTSQINGRVYDLTPTSYAAEFSGTAEGGAMAMKQTARWLGADCAGQK